MDIAEQTRYYDQYWQAHRQDLNHHETVRAGWILVALADILPDLPAGMRPAICDLGSGRGWLSDLLSKLGEVTGVDFSREAVDRARTLYPRATFQCANVLEFRPTQKFDVVVSSEVIEHIEDQAGYAKTIASILKPRGFLLMTCPNGLQQGAWERVNPSRQPIENWLTPKRLRKLLQPEFDVRYHDTFYLYFSLQGTRRIMNAPKVLRMLSALKARSAVEALRCSLGAGLYQIAVARKR